LLFILGLSGNILAQSVPVGLLNFRIEKNNTSRIYFDSELKLSLSLKVSLGNFKVSENSIVGIVINSNQKTGHYLSLKTSYTFWDNVTISYKMDKEGDLGELYSFDLMYVVNNISEPKSSGFRYVKVNGSGKHDGTLGNEWTFEEAAKLAEPGMTVWIKSGDYINIHPVIGNSGNRKSPIKFIGYKSKTGDNPNIPKSVGIKFSSSEMPLLKNGSGIGIDTNGKSYIILRNIQIENYLEYGVQLDESKYFIIDNLYIKDVDFGIRTVDFKSENNRISNTYVADCGSTGMRVYNKNNLINNSFVCSTKIVDMDYYISVYGGYQGSNNIILNSVVDRFGGDSHSGHGISLKTGDFKVKLENSLVQDCIVRGMKKSLEARHFHCDNNVYRNIKIERGREINKKKVGGIAVMNGASYNIFENITINDIDNAILVLSSKEDRDAPHAGTGNLFRNNVFNNITKVIDSKEDNSGQNRRFYNNKVINCTINDSKYLIAPKLDFEDNEFINCIINNVSSEKSKKAIKATGFTYSYSNFYNNAGFPSPKGMGNVSNDPQYIDAAKGDYRLKSTSKLINSGKTVVEVKRDYNGISRPQGASHDIGAYEFF